ncbi:MAG: nucleotidyltransferase domain-containing protein [Anaerolineales bacterium]|nr:nucleotidyltransferase domain-containing protein [Anaerolineales bacterium]
MVTPATELKRRQLLAYIESELKLHAAVKGIVAIGSLATGLARPDSDIDCIAFLDPYNDYILPAEFIWLPEDKSYHSIFIEDEATQARGYPLDFLRVDLRIWTAPGFSWPEGRKAELANGWIAYDRDGMISELIAQHTNYADDLRITRLDEAVTWLDQHLYEGGPDKRWDSLGPMIAHDRLQAAYQYLVQALFALNRRWLPWRNRQMSALLQLPWLPQGFSERVQSAVQARSFDKSGYDQRVAALRSLFADVQAKCAQEGIYKEDPIGEAFMRSNQEPGRSWNMDAWNREHRKLFG